MPKPNNKRPYFSKGRVSQAGYMNGFRDIPLDMKYSYGLAVPRNGLMACLCADKHTYSRKCCKGYLINQGIGDIYGDGEQLLENPWSEGFNQQAFGPFYQ